MIPFDPLGLLCGFIVVWGAVRVAATIDRERRASNRIAAQLEALEEELRAFMRSSPRPSGRPQGPTKDEIIAQQRERIVDLEAKLAQQAHPYR